MDILINQDRSEEEGLGESQPSGRLRRQNDALKYGIEKGINEYFANKAGDDSG